jgi:sugar lactone lactonase YvrE
MTMYRSAVLVSALVLVSLLILAGCGGGGGGAASAPAPPGAASAQGVYVLDFVHHTVSTAVQAQYVERNPIPGTPSGNTPALALALSFYSADTGNPGQQVISAKVTNNTPGPVGTTDQYAYTGIDLCFINTVFKNGSGGVVTGGGYWGYTSLNPATGTPIYNLNGPLAAGATSAPQLVDFVLPPGGVTTAIVTVIVRTDTALGYPPELTRWYLTTLAGHSNFPGYADGPTGAALFSGTNCSLYRDRVGDLLVSDSTNHCIRDIYHGQVTTFAALTGANPAFPDGLAQDSNGNVYISDSSNQCVDVVSSYGGTPITIYTATGAAPVGLAVTGNRVYVCDTNRSQVDLLTCNSGAPGGVLFSGNWSESNLGGTWSTPIGVAVDAGGNVYVTDEISCQISVLPMGSSTWTVIAGKSGGGSELSGTGLGAVFTAPRGIAVDQAGILYVADDDGGSLRRIVHTGGLLTTPTTWAVTTLAAGASVPVDGFEGAGKVCNLNGVSCARDGTLYLTEANDVRRLDRTRN